MNCSTIAGKPSRRILVVDDQPAVALAIHAVLVHFGHRVTCVLETEIALSWIATEHYDVIIADLFMPEVRGTHVIAEARRLASNARIVAISGRIPHLRSRDTSANAVKLGADAQVVRPFTTWELIAAVFPEEATASSEAAG